MWVILHSNVVQMENSTQHYRAALWGHFTAESVPTIWNKPDLIHVFLWITTSASQRRGRRSLLRALGREDGAGVHWGWFKFLFILPEHQHGKFSLISCLPLHLWPNVHLYLTVPRPSSKLFFFILFCFLVDKVRMNTTTTKQSTKT